MTAQNIDFIPDQPSSMPSSSGSLSGSSSGSLSGSSSGHIDFIPDQAAQSPGMLQGLVNNPITQGILGAGDALRNTMAGAANLIPGVHVNLDQTGSGNAYKIGNFLGNIGAFMGGGEALDAARGLAAMRAGNLGLNGVAQAAQMLGGKGLAGVGRRALGSALYGAATNPQNVSRGAGTGALESVGVDAILGGLGKLPAAAAYFQPQKYVGNILDTLSGGQSLGDASKSVASDIRNAYKTQTGAASDLYNSVRDNLPSGSIYNQVEKTNSPYLNNIDKFVNYYTPDINDLNESFITNPTFDNAHALQSQMASTIRQLQSGNKSPDIATLNTLQGLSKARKALQSDMTGFLNSQSPDLTAQYQNASNYFLDNVAPYRNNPNIYKMASGQKTNIKPSNLANLFASPDENVQKVMDDLGQDTINKILYTKLGQRSPSSYPDRFLNHFASLDQQGLGSYVSPQLNQMMNGLQHRLWAKNALQAATGGALGGVIGGKAGIPEAMGGGATGLALGRPIMNYLQYRLPMDQIGSAMKKVAQLSANSIRNAILANSINQSGV